MTDADRKAFERAVEIAGTAEEAGNLPIGTVIALHGDIIAEGSNAIWYPVHNPNRHAEIEALRMVPPGLWPQSRAMTLYTTLEPCLMCLGAILLHRIGRVLYGAADEYGGASSLIGDMPPFFERQAAQMTWSGPAYSEACNPLFARVMQLVQAHEED